jgi:O-antigen/teichoic acid export membrane protein
VHGVRWTFLGYATNRLVTFAATVVLARLLVPGDFGLVALAISVTTLLGLFSGLGLGAALVLHGERDERVEQTMLALLIAAGLAFGLALLALAEPIADAFDAPRLASVLRALTPMFVVGGLNWFYESMLQRDLDFRARFLTQAARTAVYAIVAIALAAAGAGVWSLVGGYLAMDFAYALSLMRLAPYRVRPVYRRGAASEALATGRGFVLQGTAEFLQQNADYLAVGRILGVSRLGAYSMAYRLGEIPSGAVAIQVATVTFPRFAQMRQRGEDVIPGYETALRAVVLLTMPLGMVLSAAAEPFTQAVFGSRWLAMIGPLGVFGLWAAVRPIMATQGWLLNSIGQARAFGRLSLLVLPPHVTALVIAAELGSIETVAWVMLAHMVAVVALLMWLLSRHTGIEVAAQIRPLRGLVVAGAACWAATRVIAETVAPGRSGVTLVAAVAAGMAAYLATLAALERPLLRTTLGQARGLLGARPSEGA